MSSRERRVRGDVEERGWSPHRCEARRCRPSETRARRTSSPPCPVVLELAGLVESQRPRAARRCRRTWRCRRSRRSRSRAPAWRARFVPTSPCPTARRNRVLEAEAGVAVAARRGRAGTRSRRAPCPSRRPPCGRRGRAGTAGRSRPAGRRPTARGTARSWDSRTDIVGRGGVRRGRTSDVRVGLRSRTGPDRRRAGQEVVVRLAELERLRARWAAGRSRGSSGWCRLASQVRGVGHVEREVVRAAAPLADDRDGVELAAPSCVVGRGAGAERRCSCRPPRRRAPSPCRRR